MDDPKPTPSNAPDPDAIPLRPEDASVEPPPTAEPVIRDDEVIESGVPTPFSTQSVQPPPAPVPEYDGATGELVAVHEPGTVLEPPPARDHLPGNAAAEEIPLREPPPGDAPLIVPTGRIAGPADRATADIAVAARPPRQGLFTLWALIWIAAWAGGMFLTLDHRFDRRFDWNTSYFSVAARNLVRDGFVAARGGVFLTAGDFKEHRGDSFYAGHPPLTTWLLAGWMKALGDRDWVIRALPLAFSVLNLLLIYALVRRVFGAPAGLAAVVFASLFPMTAYYAQIVNMEPFVLTFMLGGALGYLSWARSSSRLGFLLLVLCVILGCWTDWPMYLFTGFLAVMHFLRRRDGLIVSTPDGRETVERAGRPFASTLFLLMIPVLTFGAFWAYVKLNGGDLSELTARANERRGGYGLLLDRLTDRKELKSWFLDLFTPAALLLAGLGAALWPSWTRRLSLASGEAARRAAFRIVLAFVLTQIVYTVAFPQGAWTHEFWQYYLIVPVAVLAAGLCTWLTVAGVPPRRFQWGLADRAAWSVVALIPLLAVGPFAYRMQLNVLGKDLPKPDPNAQPAFVDALRGATDARDVILTDWDQNDLGFAAQWYADRAMIPYAPGGDHDTHSIAGIEKLAARYKDRRVLYLWADGDGPESLFEALNKRFRPRPAGPLMLYVIHEPGGAPATTAPSVATPLPATGPATTTTAPTTRPTP